MTTPLEKTQEHFLSRLRDQITILRGKGKIEAEDVDYIFWRFEPLSRMGVLKGKELQEVIEGIIKLLNNITRTC
jgi:hypothetical protein